MGFRGFTTIQKWSTIIGAFLMTFPVGLQNYWGNMSVYVMSYYLIRRQSQTGVQAQWVIPLYFGFESVGLFTVGLLSKRVGKRVGLLCGMVLFLGGIFGTYFALKSSIIVMNVTLGVMSGFGSGFVLGMSLEYATSWAGKRVGFVTSLVLVGYNSGPLVFNAFVSMYTNPQNKSPDFEFGPSSYFSQRDVLGNVSNLFIVFGCICLGIQAIGFLVVREFKTDSDEKDYLKQTTHHNVPDGVEGRESEGVGVNDEQTLSPRQTIKTMSFYTLWFLGLFYTTSLVIILTYYKSYGQVWVNDDYFLAWVGTAFTLATLVSGPVWGIITDRIGVKTSLAIMYALSAVHVFFLYFAPRHSKWMYLAGMVVFGSCSVSIFTTLMTATCSLFGKTHYSSNFGLVISSDIFMGFITPTIMKLLLVKCGWFSLFCFAACLNIASSLLVILTLPRC